MRLSQGFKPHRWLQIGLVPRALAHPATLVLFCGWLATSSLYAQRTPGTVGLGLQVGRPGGVAMKMYRPNGIAYDAVLTTDADDFVAGYFHRLWEQPIPDSPLHLYLGPGVVTGVDGLSDSIRIRVGVSAEAGLNFYAERFEVFLHVTPALRFFPNRRAYLDGNVGLRYYFGLQ